MLMDLFDLLLSMDSNILEQEYLGWILSSVR